MLERLGGIGIPDTVEFRFLRGGMGMRRLFLAGIVTIALGGLPAIACAQSAAGTITPRTLLSMPPDHLLALYASGSAQSVPAGPIRGHVLSLTGSSLAGPVALGGRAVWQGKVFSPQGTAINHFFGVPAVRGAVSFGPSWFDGKPSLILDYAQTSRVYRNYRDEIREVAPGVYLGLMYDRTTHPVKLVRFFALER
jgi:hypothetical protein